MAELVRLVKTRKKRGGYHTRKAAAAKRLPGRQLKARTSTCQRPQDWAQAVLAAYWIGLGFTDAESATLSGCGTRTVGRWKVSEWWPQAEAEAHRRFLTVMSAETKRSVLDVVRDRNPLTRDPATIRWAAERLIDGLAKPAEKLVMTGKDGGPVEIDWRVLVMERLNHIAAASEEGEA